MRATESLHGTGSVTGLVDRALSISGPPCRRPWSEGESWRGYKTSKNPGATIGPITAGQALLVHLSSIFVVGVVFNS